MKYFGDRPHFAWGQTPKIAKQLMDSLDDMSANLQGIECDENTSCEECCCIYKVNGL